MNIFKVSLLSFLSTSTKMIAGLIISKSLALSVGPSGMALVGQFQNFVQIALTIAKGALDTGVTKYVAEYSADKQRQLILFSTATRLSAASCVLVMFILLFGADFFSHQILHSYEYAYIVRLFAVTICMFVLNSLLLSIINGLQEVPLYILINVVQSVITLLITAGLVFFLKLDGALIALVTNQSLVLLFLLWKLRNHAVIKIANFKQKIDKIEAIKLAKYGVMASVSAIVTPLSIMLVRDAITNILGIEQAGYWQAMWYISSVYLTIVTTSLSVYYLPKLSKITESHEIRKELMDMGKIVLPVVALAAFILYVIRGWMVSMLFSDAFLPMIILFKWMLIGDVIKIASWLVAYLMLAKAMTRAFIITEILFSASFVFFSIISIQIFGLEGLGYAFAINYFLYFFAVLKVTRRIWL